MTEGYARCGEVFTVPILNKRITFLISPEVCPHFFKATDDEMSQTEVNGGPMCWQLAQLRSCPISCPQLES